MIKMILFKALGLKYYLRVLHTCFHFLYSINALKGNYVYKYHYFDAQIIREGDHILDIGANLGYYTKLFAKWAGNRGFVYAIEPIGAFSETIKWGTQGYHNVAVYNYALGAEERDVQLSTPGRYGYLRTGLPKVLDNAGEQQSYEFTFNATMKKGSRLFGSLQKLDFIKCDIEGYEEFVLPEMRAIIEHYKPVIQLETWGQQKQVVEGFLKDIGYEEFDLEDGVLRPVTSDDHTITGDLFFIHKDNNIVLERLGELKNG